MNKIDRFFYLYGRFVLFPVALFLFILLSYFYIAYPQAFVYDCTVHPHEPIISPGVSWYGVRLTDPFLVPQLSAEACRHKLLMNDVINVITIFSLFGLGYVAYRRYEREIKGLFRRMHSLWHKKRR